MKVRYGQLENVVPVAGRVGGVDVSEEISELLPHLVIGLELLLALAAETDDFVDDLPSSRGGASARFVALV